MIPAEPFCFPDQRIVGPDLLFLFPSFVPSALIICFPAPRRRPPSSAALPRLRPKSLMLSALATRHPLSTYSLIPFLVYSSWGSLLRKLSLAVSLHKQC